MDEKILIFTTRTAPRLVYTLDLVFEHILGTEYCLTHSQEEFKSFQGAKLNYSEHAFGDELFFYSERLLFEKGIEDQEVSVFDWNGTKALFGTHPKYEFPFDPFSASFYLVSRYEEYLPHLRDAHDRYVTSEAIAFQRNFLSKPVVNIWAKKIKEAILKHYPSFAFSKQKYKYISTVDIDDAYAYLEKGFMRTTGAYFRSLFHLNFEQIIERTRVLIGLQNDPFDTFDYQLALHKKYNVRCIYFVLLAEYGENDKNVPPDNKNFQSLIKSLADYSQVGIHPSYNSARNPARIRKEVNLLGKILKREVTCSRQHFLKLHFPRTYRTLIDLDITDDYSLGYAASIGFRASICTPFYFYDLDMEQTTSLLIHPFAVMEASLKYYMKIPPEEAMSHIKPLVDEVRAVEGTFISLWHNEALSENTMWKGWKKVYEDLIEYAS